MKKLGKSFYKFLQVMIGGVLMVAGAFTMAANIQIESPVIWASLKLIIMAAFIGGFLLFVEALMYLTFFRRAESAPKSHS